jgi:hypothetical protein
LASFRLEYGRLKSEALGGRIGQLSDELNLHPGATIPFGDAKQASVGDVPVALQQNHVARGNGKGEIFSKSLEGSQKRMIPFQPPFLPC